MYRSVLKNFFGQTDKSKLIRIFARSAKSRGKYCRHFFGSDDNLRNLQWSCSQIRKLFLKILARLLNFITVRYKFRPLAGMM